MQKNQLYSFQEKKNFILTNFLWFYRNIMSILGQVICISVTLTLTLFLTLTLNYRQIS